MFQVGDRVRFVPIDAAGYRERDAGRPELFPTRVRATAQGATYNLGRLLSAAAPYTVAALAERRGLGFAFNLVAAAFAVARCWPRACPRRAAASWNSPRPA